MNVIEYERLRTQERAARENAAYHRELTRIGSCGLPMKLTPIGYGTHEVRPHIAARVADMFSVWADESEAIANGLKVKMEAMLSVPESSDSGSDQ